MPCFCFDLNLIFKKTLVVLMSSLSVPLFPYFQYLNNGIRAFLCIIPATKGTFERIVSAYCTSPERGKYISVGQRPTELNGR